ncbi:sensor histidine kinase [Luteimonas vadosa]
MNRTQAPMPGPAHWDAGPFSPLSWAAYITWLAVVLQVVAWERLPGGVVSEWAGLACLLLFLAAFVGRSVVDRNAEDCHPWSGPMVLLQAAFALAASWLLGSATVAVLVVIVAAQLIGIYPLRIALAWLVAINVLLAVAWLQFIEWPRMLLVLVPMLGFQAFAGLTSYYATSSEIARQELARANAQLLATRELLDQSARSEERLRLSRELHDVAGHKLTALKLNLARLARDPGVGAREEIEIATTLAHELLDDIRAVVGELRKHDGIDLRDSLQALVRQIPDDRITLAFDDDLRVGSVQSAETLLRCAQEAITNALRHGRARHVEVACTQDAGHVTLTIDDDGAVQPAISFGHGLNGMRERVEALDGRLAVTPRAGRGVRVVASLPAGA